MATKTKKVTKATKATKATKRDLVALAKAARERAARLEGELALENNPEAQKLKGKVKAQSKRVNAYNRLIALRKKSVVALARKLQAAESKVDEMFEEQSAARIVLDTLEEKLADLLGKNG